MTDWWEYPNNFSNNTGVNGVGDFFKYINYGLSDWYGTGFILLIWILSFGFSMMLGVRKALMTASFISFIFSIYLARAGLISPWFVGILIVLTIIGAIGSKEETTL